ncbi:hypothetical protein DXT76_12155 [Halobacillus trueperi]|uniref:Uncharacterized protein n=1 Tax=Halobacillus trueperi TaxID=156205 RepID=A0A3D8VN27_9BACI|nr:hypothetical protein [Halobacillus trueperi]RDY70667.1 hypothetical protein DXT76_12155 [Halobacillus trueperi]
MGISVIVLIFFMIVGIIMAVVPSLIVKKQGRGPFPYKRSLSIGVLLLVHWVLWLSGFYALLPMGVADAIFLPVWFVLCAFGAVFAGLEFKNNAAFAIPLAGFTFVSFVFALFMEGLSKM